MEVDQDERPLVEVATFDTTGRVRGTSTGRTSTDFNVSCSRFMTTLYEDAGIYPQ
jgi:hypothetical protein